MKIKDTLWIFGFTIINIIPTLTAVTLSILLVIGSLTANAQDAIYVTKSGSPDPDGSVSKPYHVVESGIARARLFPPTTLKIGPGKYYETFTVGRRVTLEANGGVVTIGKLDYQASTTLDIITLNTHLAGDQAFMPSWKDKARAYDIAIQLRDMGLDKPDVVGFQEIWDEDLFFGGDGVTLGILRRSEYHPHGDHGQIEKGFLGGNSGLALMSKYPLENFLQIPWLWSAGEDAFANKGWVQATIRKGGFHITLFNLHMQAEGASIRATQIAQLALTIQAWRGIHPDHVVFVMGDFNIKGEGSEYYDTLIGWMELANGKDADRNSPGFIVDTNFTDQWTSDDSNLLSYYFGSVGGWRLDYIYYIPSLDGSIEVIPTDVTVLPFRGRTLSEDGLTTNESSDHWAVHGQFKLIRK